ncbi:MAG: ABC transporter substrate-binding protein [Chloroflexi bacterium]|nr:ABC transporter substrate-binding protein [Chloroflexota bacterium]
MNRLWLSIVATFLLTASACAPAAAPSPTAAPARPTEKPAAKAEPTAAAPAKPAATAAPAAKPAEVKVPKPAGSLAIKVGETAGLSYSRIPSRVTLERLNKDGWKLELVELKGTDLIAEAVSSGETPLARFQFLDSLRTVQAGGKLKLLMEDRPEEFVVIGKKEITKCQDMNGKRYAVHSEGSPYATMSAKWMNDCGAKPNRLVISGGENRIVALMNGQIDATFVQLSDWINLDTQRPGEFPIIMRFADVLPGLMGGILVANSAWLEKNREVTTAYMAESLLDNRRIASDSKPAEEAVKKLMTEADVKAFAKTYQAYQRDLGGFPQNGGLTADRIQRGINLFTELELVKPGLAPNQVADLSLLEGALKIVGSVAGQR